MRTKTILLSALLGALGSVSLMAQINVYSLNAVGYINVGLVPGYNIISCPLISSPDNTLNTLLTATNGTISGFKYYPWVAGSGYGASDTANAKKWLGGGNETLNPGQAGFLFVPPGATVTNLVFVGTVPDNANYNMTNWLYPGYNLLSSVLPTSGVLTNGLQDFNGQVAGDHVYTWNAAGQTYNSSYSVKANGSWITPPTISSVGTGFFYYNSQTTVTNTWVENFSVGQ
jgi:hypothetical protein